MQKYLVLLIDNERGLVLNHRTNRLVTTRPARIHVCLKMAAALNANVGRRAEAAGA